jgi:23S rRNA pseudouridine2605 synthase
MQERLQKIIARAGIASRRHAEQLILSGQVRVNGRVVTELGTKADAAKDKIDVAQHTIHSEKRRVYLAMHKPPETVSALTDPEGRKTLRNYLRGFPERVFPVGSLEYGSSGLVFLTNDGELAAELLKHWDEIEHVYHVKVKGKLTLADLQRLGKAAGARLRILRQPDAGRGHAQNFWYEARLKPNRRDALRDVLFREKHPVEKFKRVGFGPLTLEGIPVGRYRILEAREVEAFRKMIRFGSSVKAQEIRGRGISRFARNDGE